MLLVAVTYLSRARGQSSRPRSNNPQNLMDTQQARGVLGMDDAPLTAEAVIAAHRRLMQRVHPDKGGSQVLAQQLNEAKRVLLRELS